MNIAKLLQRFDRKLDELGIYFEGVVVGGAALTLLGVITRPTRDVDVLSPAIPADVLDAAVKLAGELRNSGASVSDDWLNNGPSSLQDALPAGWQTRLVPLLNGQRLNLKPWRVLTCSKPSCLRSATGGWTTAIVC